MFGPDALEVVVAGKETEETENKFVGGANRWSYDSCVVLVVFSCSCFGWWVWEEHRGTARALCVRERC